MSDKVSTSSVMVGNAGADGAGRTRGWFVGHFVSPPESPRRTDAVEVKWAIHAAGESRPNVATGDETTTLSILVGGAFRLVFQDSEVRLSRQGDYVLFPPGVPHTWTADEDSIVVTVRWPSRPSR